MKIEKSTKNKDKIIEWAKFLLVFIISFAVIKFSVSRVIISGESMVPTFQHGDMIIAERISYLFTNPKKGDIIVFKVASKNQNFVKRIIGTPGDVISIENNYFYVNGEKLNDEFTEQILSIGDTVFPLTVTEDSYFVLGDNRNRSQDSTFSEVGLISKKNILGRGLILFYPYKHFKLL